MVDACPLMTADALPRPYVHLNLPLYMWLIDQRQEATVASLSLADRTRSSFSHFGCTVVDGPRSELQTAQ